MAAVESEQLRVRALFRSATTPHGTHRTAATPARICPACMASGRLPAKRDSTSPQRVARPSSGEAGG